MSAIASAIPRCKGCDDVAERQKAAVDEDALPSAISGSPRALHAFAAGEVDEVDFR